MIQGDSFPKMPLQATRLPVLNQGIIERVELWSERHHTFEQVRMYYEEKYPVDLYETHVEMIGVVEDMVIGLEDQPIPVFRVYIKRRIHAQHKPLS